MLSWIKRNKLVTLLLIVVTYFFLNSLLGSSLMGLRSVGISMPKSNLPESASLSAPGVGRFNQPDIYPPTEFIPQPDIKDRLVTQESQLSLLVENVVEAKDKIVAFAKTSGGYMVTSTVANPQDVPTATVVVRVQSAKLQEALGYFHGLAVKVVSENLVGQDVTDQYVDIEKRIAILENTMARFAAILAEAREVSDIVNLNQQIINIQSQIDSLKGQQEALKQNSQLAKITIYLSTDEIALPYAPSETFRPGVIFKLAVRSLVGHLRQIATVAIWLGVFAVIWVPALLIGLGVYRKFKKS